MDKRATLEVIAPTVEEAVNQGLSELGLPPEAVEVEVLDSGARGLFGLGGRQVRVRLTVKGEATDSAVTTQAEPVDTSPQQAAETDDELLRLAEQTVAELLNRMKIPARLSTRYGEADADGRRPVLVDIRGDDLGVLIGRRAEILNALQYIVNLIVSKQMESWVQIVIDVEGYRMRRDRQLRQMARRMAEQAVRTGRRQVLEPMTASERRIIHLELRDHPQVLTQSIGEEPARKVTIVPK
ncbi:MAG: RNA-binding cell elongation regulator Jag/EloR [Anaerolineales bacterium]